MTLFWFREPQFSGSVGNRSEPLSTFAKKSHVTALSPVPGTARNRSACSGSRFFPSLDGNRDQHRQIEVRQ